MKKREQEARKIIRKLYEWKGMEIIEGKICLDRIRLLLSISSKISISRILV